MWRSSNQLTGHRCDEDRIGAFSGEHAHVGLQIDPTARRCLTSHLTRIMVVGAADHLGHRHRPAGASRERHEHQADGDERTGEASRDVDEHLFESGPFVRLCQSVGRPLTESGCVRGGIIWVQHRRVASGQGGTQSSNAKNLSRAGLASQ